VGAWLGSTVPTVGQKTMANSVPVTIALDQNSPGFVDPFLQAKRFGILIGKTAVGYHVMGRRSGANSTSILQDCGEFLGTSIDTFPELTGVEALEVVSSSANDTAAGTGTRTLQITYMDTSNNLVVSSPITMNGVTPVSLGALRAKFIYWMEAVTGGTLETGAGNILLRIAGGGATQEQISANANRSLSCRFAVPAGFTAYISFWQASGAGGGTFDVRLRGTTFADGITLSTRYLFKDNCLIGTAGGDITNEIPWLSFASLARIKCSALYSAAAPANRLDCDMSILLIAN
jgi:hypothetical protein